MYGYGQPGMPGMPRQYGNPYMAEPVPQRFEITRVSGRNGADAYQMPPNSSVLLLDDSAPIVWLKMTDGAGYPTLTPYQITPYKAQPQPDFNSFEARLARLEAMYDESHPASHESKSRKQSGANDSAAH